MDIGIITEIGERKVEVPKLRPRQTPAPQRPTTPAPRVKEPA